MTRRKFLDNTLAAAPVLAFPGLIGASCQSAAGTAGPSPTPTPAPGAKQVLSEARLTQPRIIRASDGQNVNSSLVMKMKEWVYDGKTLKLKDATTPANATILNLRTYGSAIDPNRPIDPDTDDNLEYTIPGPTFAVQQGQYLNIDLYNRLPVSTTPDDECTPNDPNDPDQFPDCFHGANTTNIHYHGSHVSPNEPQDFVFLQLRPKGADPDPNNPDVRVGDYQSRVGPFPETQAVETQWYHPHKHGSTALQVLNGMGGTFLVEGYLDAFLKQQLPGLAQKVLVIQQIKENLNFPRAAGGDGPLRINSTLNPVIEMRSGEIQWWRFVGTTQQASANVVIQFESQPGETPDMRQIAQDGVPFATENYQRETFNLAREAALTLLGDRRPILAAIAQGAQQQFQIAPGNRLRRRGSGGILSRCPPGRRMRRAASRFASAIEERAARDGLGAPSKPSPFL